ncbi:GNAT family protein [Streptomyces sp. CRN 30]|uniref:GNAT family N-acetyltransferase n=1 Tax=Streptomyces sp. CRN 30 TaxID=3075613 RepID=UPI002A83104B|nr:GNAT family protein [Streptomyces sp. CRN 30]
MSHQHWPLAGLTVSAGPLLLRSPTLAECHGLAEEAAREPHDPSVPFLAGPADDAVRRGRRTLQYLWGEWALLQPQRWSLTLAVFVDGAPAGLQNTRARGFPRRGTVEHGLWILPARRGQGIGTRAHAAALHLAFEGLGAHRAFLDTAADNHAALAVTGKLGYEPCGATVASLEPGNVRMLRLTAERWRAQHRTQAPVVGGLEDCLPLLGSPPAGPPAHTGGDRG